MHILYFHQHFSTPHGAAGTRSYEMAQALIRAGHSVTIVCGSYAQGTTGLQDAFTKGRRRGFVEGIDVIEFEVDYSNDMTPIQRIGVFIKYGFRSLVVALREPADVVFATTTPLTAGIPGIVARWLTGRPFIFEVRDLWPELPRAMGVITNPLLLWLMSILEWLAYRSADRLIGLSPGIVKGICARGVDNERIALVPNGCDLDIFTGSVSPRRPDGVREDQLLAVFTGTHGQANGLETVLKAAKVLKDRQRDDICLVLIGNGGEKSKLISNATELDLDNILFLDSIPKIELAGLLAGADLGLQVLRNVPAFYFGTSPNKFFDYISAGLPVLNNYPGWLSELITDFDCGFSVAPDDPAAFADALIGAAEDRQALKKKGINAQRLARDRFARSKLSTQWVEWVTFSESR